MLPRTSTGPLRTAVPAVIVAAALALGGCGSKEEPQADGPTPSSTPSAPTTKKPTPTAGDSISQAARSRRLAGTRSPLSVIGVAQGARLELHAGPSATSAVVTRLRPLAHGLAPTGEQRGTWVQVRKGDVDGWADAGHVGALGKATSYQAQVATFDIGATRRQAAAKAARALGLGTSAVFVRVQHPVVVLDVFGAEDDSILGTRFRVVLEYGEAGFVVKEAASRPICARGVNAEGLCQ